MARTVYEIVTEKIIEGLQKGKIAWRMPWSKTATGETPFISYQTGRPYSFLNTMLLMISGAPEGEFITYKQCKEQGGKIREGAKSYMVTFSTYWTPEDKKTEDEEKDPKFWFLRYYQVFAVGDCEGITPRHEIEVQEKEKHELIAEAEVVVNLYDKAQEGLKIYRNTNSNEAYYQKTNDVIVVPQIGQYKDEREYYSTLFHEMVHSTGHEKRLNRKEVVERNSFGSKDYSKEELVAELGSQFIMNRLGISTEKVENNSQAYINHWIEFLKNDPKAIVIAAAQAEKAVHYICQD